MGKSKHNLTNKEEYTEAERELLKAMSLKEAKARTAEIQKVRALMSYKEHKFRQQKKIKSKRSLSEYCNVTCTYHEPVLLTGFLKT